MRKIKPLPVTSLRIPRYPTKLEVQADPDLLRKHLPPGWVRFLGTSGAVGLLLAQLQGCVIDMDSILGPSPTPTPTVSPSPTPTPPSTAGVPQLTPTPVSLSEERLNGLREALMKYEDVMSGQANMEGPEMARSETIAVSLAKDELRQQVQEFVNWLKAQGVI